MHLIPCLRHNPRNPHFMAHHRRHNAGLQTLRDCHNRTVQIFHAKIGKNIRILDVRTDGIADFICDVLDHLRIPVHDNHLAAAAL